MKPDLRRWVCVICLAGCGHSPASTTDLDRSTGPWQAGPPVQLTAHPVEAIGLSASGNQVLFRFRDWPSPPYAGPRTRDTSDFCLGMVPATGGSGVWRFCDLRSEQSDSANNILTAAIDGAGALIYVESTGPIDTVEPAREHIELYRGDRDNTGVRRRLLTLYRDVLGRPTVGPSTVNWLTELRWTGPGRFVALGYNVPPEINLYPVFLGLLFGEIGSDSASYTLLTDLSPIARIAAGYRGTVIVAGTNLLVRALSDDDGHEIWSSTIAPLAGRRVVALGCDPSGCRALSREPDRSGVLAWRIGPTLDQAELAGEIPIPYSTEIFISAADGAVIYSTDAGLFRIEPKQAP